MQPRRSRLPVSFHYDFAWGDLGVFVMDLRSQRVAVDPHGSVYGDDQLDDLRSFLAASADKRAIVLVTSVPIVHVPEWMADTGHWMFGRRVDFGDQWSFHANARDRDRLLAEIHRHMQEHPEQRVVIVGGDVHVAAAFEIRWDQGRSRVLHQLTSSALSNRLGAFERLLAPGAPRAASRIAVPSGSKRLGARVSLLASAQPRYRENPFAGLNVGIIDFIRNGERRDLRFRIAGYVHDGGAPRPKIHWSSQIV